MKTKMNAIPSVKQPVDFIHIVRELDRQRAKREKRKNIAKALGFAGLLILTGYCVFRAFLFGLGISV